MSLARVVCPKRKCTCCDFFKSIERIGEIESKTLLIHGQEDQLVGINHSIELYKLLKNPAQPAWISGADHNNIYEFSEVWLQIMKFVYDLFPELYKHSREFDNPRQILMKHKLEARKSLEKEAFPNPLEVPVPEVPATPGFSHPQEEEEDGQQYESKAEVETVNYTDYYAGDLLYDTYASFV